MSPAARLLLGASLAIGGLIAAAALYEHRHPCMRYAAQRVFVPELTTYIEINGGTINAAGGGFSMPVTTPAHYEETPVCQERK